ncbi:HD-GYP domain-containing protein [Candidatus Latescibacterota bacterium]
MVTSKETEYIPITLNAIKVDTMRSFDIFIKHKKNKTVLYHTGGDLFTSEVRDKLLENNISVLYIRKLDYGAYEQYIEDNLGHLLTDSEINNEEKSNLAHSSVSNLAKSLFSHPNGKIIRRYKESISSTMDFILKEEEAIYNLIRLTNYDFSTYTHSVNVGIFSIGLAKALFADKSDHNMQEIASGFFLHDIGKCNISHEILNKNGPLTEVEWEKMKKHPFLGYQLLKKFNALTEEAKVIVMEHHERYNGKGYPNGLKGDKIHIYSKICCISDVFEALTARRPYKTSKSSFDALKIMKNEMIHEFDPHFFEQFVLLFQKSNLFNNKKAPE